MNLSVEKRGVKVGFAKPNIMQLSSSFIITDPKGELCRDTAGFLEHHGYEVKVLNLLDMKKSSRYNPFDYVQTDTDVIKLIQNLIRNTTPKGASPGDPFWEKAEGMFLQSIFYYVWKEGVKNEETGKVEHNIGAVLKLLDLAEFTEDRNGNTLDTSDKFDISSDVPFIISRDKEELCKGSFLGLDAYYTELDAAQYDEYYTIIDSGSDDDIEYTFYSSEDEYDYLIHLKDSQTAIMLQNDVSEASAKECFARLNFKFTH